MARVSFAPPSPEQIAEARRLAQQSLRPVNWEWAPDSPQMRVLTAITAPLRYLIEQTIAGKTLQRVSEKAGERVVFQPGAYQEMWQCRARAFRGSMSGAASQAILPALAQIHMANQLLGPALAAVGQVPPGSQGRAGRGQGYIEAADAGARSSQCGLLVPRSQARRSIPCGRRCIPKNTSQALQALLEAR